MATLFGSFLEKEHTTTTKTLPSSNPVGPRFLVLFLEKEQYHHNKIAAMLYFNY
jgi:hypothetical protein